MLFVNAQWTKSNRYPLNKKISPHHVEQAPDIHNIKGHAPRERVSWNANFYNSIGVNASHAPRERVSWNRVCMGIFKILEVTLHVSVWVEIEKFVPCPCSNPSRSTWACELKCMVCNANPRVTRSRSTWACELKYRKHFSVSVWGMSRSTWACELKYPSVMIRKKYPMSRSTWACELKLQVNLSRIYKPWQVTLHVSVWVEIPKPISAKYGQYVTLHVSVWVEMFVVLKTV